MYFNIAQISAMQCSTQNITTSFSLANYVLMGKYDAVLANGKDWMEYQLVSSVQYENGRRMFWPHFGFFYKAAATKISVHMYDLSSQSLHPVIDLGVVNPLDNEISEDMDWMYVSKNFSTITEFIDMWDANTDKLWQVTSETYFVTVCSHK